MILWKECARYIERDAYLDATHAKEIKVRRWIDKEDGGGIHHKTIQYIEREKK